MNKNIKTYSIFHLNMSFSSIEESDRAIVLSRCYWPLLRLIEAGFPLAIEATGLTLEYIDEIDPQWTKALKRLVHEGKCEFIGSGYAQLIGPLVPYRVNVENLRAGNAVYQNLLDITPNLALINEQAYSPSLVDIYLEVGYTSIIMDWANPHSQHRQEWSPSWRYYPQRALGVSGKTISLIWVDSIPFQRFQRYVHGETDIDDMFEYLAVAHNDENIGFPLYGNDAEIFDYRPGRFATEPAIETENEWERMRELLEAMEAKGNFEFVHPSAILALSKPGASDNILSLESPNDPVPVKKQPKYNILRWAATGRDDVCANTACWRAFHRLQNDPNSTSLQWRTLCKLWSSDFRTHITDTRWRDYISELADFGAFGKRPKVISRSDDAQRLRNGDYLDFQVSQDKHNLTIKTDSGILRLRLMRGLAIEGFWPKGDDQSLYRTIPHGYFSDINLGADFYSGHLVAQIVGRPQVTDLEKVDPEIFYDPDGRFVDIEAHVSTLAGPLFKRVRFFANEPRVEIRYRVDWLEGVQGAMHFGNVTLNPAGFDRSSLFYAVHNGGQKMERHSLAEQDVDHMRAPSFLVSARAATGMTEGRFIIGDAKRRILLECPRDIAAMPAMLTCKAVDNKFFCRVAFSSREIDDTAKQGPFVPMPGRSEFMYAMTAMEPDDELN